MKHRTNLGQHVRILREAAGLSAKQLAERSDMSDGTVIRIENGLIAAPRPDKLARLAEALNVPAADLYALADYTPVKELPSFRPYLRTKYGSLSAEAIDDVNEAFERIVREHGYDPAGPQPGADE